MKVKFIRNKMDIGKSLFPKIVDFSEIINFIENLTCEIFLFKRILC